MESVGFWEGKGWWLGEPVFFCRAWVGKRAQWRTRHKREGKAQKKPKAGVPPTGRDMPTREGREGLGEGERKKNCWYLRGLGSSR